ncbi:MAG: helix-turn-helix transcriptional regulator [Gemmatimonadaceae bacterium]|nr:helix-turn-helix transcriptional regulator [Gemmatimonadaceae bacterium]
MSIVRALESGKVQMALVLTLTDQSQLATTFEAMLSPFASATPDAWFVRIGNEMKALCHGDSALVCAQHRGHGRHFSADAPELAAEMDARCGFRDGELRFPDPTIDAGLIERRRRSVDAWTAAMLNDVAGGGYYGSEFYNEVAIPFKARATMALAVHGPEGEVMLGVNNERPVLDPLSEDTLGLLALMLPAFRAGFEMLSRLEFSRHTLATALDGLAEGMMVFGLADSRELYRNGALIAMLADDPEHLVVERRILQLVRGLCFMKRGRAGERLRAPAVLDEIATRRARYRARFTLLSSGIFSRDEAVLVAIEAPAPRLPSAPTLTARYKLTKREAEVALKLATGASDVDLARMLGISAHTVRHHTENIFAKLNVHSRKALALHLLNGESPRQR